MKNHPQNRVLQEPHEIALTAFTSRDRVLAEQLLRHKQFMNKWERDLRNRHFERLHDGLVESQETSAIHLDVLTNLKRINSHLTAVAYPILEKGGGSQPPRASPM